VGLQKREVGWERPGTPETVIAKEARESIEAECEFSAYRAPVEKGIQFALESLYLVGLTDLVERLIGTAPAVLEQIAADLGSARFSDRLQNLPRRLSPASPAVGLQHGGGVTKDLVLVIDLIAAKEVMLKAGEPGSPP
jgi:hypothetical protein